MFLQVEWRRYNHTFDHVKAELHWAVQHLEDIRLRFRDRTNDEATINITEDSLSSNTEFVGTPSVIHSSPWEVKTPRLSDIDIDTPEESILRRSIDIDELEEGRTQLPPPSFDWVHPSTPSRSVFL